MPFLRYLIRHVAVKKFNNEETELLCQEYTGVNNLGLGSYIRIVNIYIIDSYDKTVDDEGYLYCVSTSDDSYMELIDERDRLEDNGKICVLGGSYNNGGAVGVQYEYKGQ